MVSSKSEDNPQSRRNPTTVEGIQNQLIALAYDEAKRQLLSGTASSQVITQLMKEGSLRTQLELEKLRQDSKLSEAKVVAMESVARQEELFERAMAAFKGYQPSQDDDIV